MALRTGLSATRVPALRQLAQRAVDRGAGAAKLLGQRRLVRDHLARLPFALADAAQCFVLDGLPGDRLGHFPASSTGLKRRCAGCRDALAQLCVDRAGTSKYVRT
jgi:hypothetical protein